MPHFGLMDETKMGKADAALMRARLHIRGGRRRLRQKKVAAGLVTLYDALLSAMRWYLLTNNLQDKLPGGTETLENERVVFAALKKANVLDASFDFGAIEKIVDQALMEEDLSLDTNEFLLHIEQAMTTLGVMPFDENALPPEDPATF